jgi:hypothetical protein
VQFPQLPSESKYFPSTQTVQVGSESASAGAVQVLQPDGHAVQPFTSAIIYPSPHTEQVSLAVQAEQPVEQATQAPDTLAKAAAQAAQVSLLAGQESQLASSH